MENKKVYIKPVLESETFIPQNYIAACGDENKVYLFKCDATGGRMGYVFQETNGKEGLQVDLWGGDKLLTSVLGGYHACNATHEAPTTDEFLKGYYITSKDGIDAEPVIIWRGPGNDNVHCTKNLKIDSWPTAKS